MARSALAVRSRSLMKPPGASCAMRVSSEENTALPTSAASVHRPGALTRKSRRSEPPSVFSLMWVEVEGPLRTVPTGYASHVHLPCAAGLAADAAIAAFEAGGVGDVVPVCGAPSAIETL